MENPNKEIELTVQVVSYPKDGKKLGYVKSSEGEFYGADPGMLNKFQTGEVCKIEYSETPKKSGDGSWKNIKKKISTAPVLTKAPYIAPRQRTDDRDQEQITVRLIMEKMITPDSTWVEIAEVMQQARKVYRMTWAIKPENADINDDIPY